MKSLFSSLSIIRLVSLVFCFIERLIYSHYIRFMTVFKSFSKTWLEIPLSDKRVASLSYDYLNKQNQAHAKPRHVSIALPDDSRPRASQLKDISVWNPEESQTLSRPMNLSIASKTQNELWSKIKEMANEGDNSKNFTTNIYDHKVKCHGRRNYMSSTFLKLDDYHRKNREFILNGEFHQFSFNNFSAKPAYSKNPIVPGGSDAFKAKPRCQKKRIPPFRPTELSTIFENLAY
jgi:hypothetical protein